MLQAQNIDPIMMSQCCPICEAPYTDRVSFRCTKHRVNGSVTGLTLAFCRGPEKPRRKFPPGMSFSVGKINYGRPISRDLREPVTLHNYPGGNPG